MADLWLSLPSWMLMEACGDRLLIQMDHTWCWNDTRKEITPTMLYNPNLQPTTANCIFCGAYMCEKKVRQESKYGGYACVLNVIFGANQEDRPWSRHFEWINEYCLSELSPFLILCLFALDTPTVKHALKLFLTHRATFLHEAKCCYWFKTAFQRRYLQFLKRGCHIFPATRNPCGHPSLLR